MLPKEEADKVLGRVYKKTLTSQTNYAMMLQSHRLFHLSSGYQVFEEYSSVVDKTKNGQKKPGGFKP